MTGEAVRPRTSPSGQLAWLLLNMSRQAWLTFSRLHGLHILSVLVQCPQLWHLCMPYIYTIIRPTYNSVVGSLWSLLRKHETLSQHCFVPVPTSFTHQKLEINSINMAWLSLRSFLRLLHNCYPNWGGGGICSTLDVLVILMKNNQFLCKYNFANNKLTI